MANSCRDPNVELKMNLTDTESIVLVCAANEGYVMPLATMIRSVLANINTQLAISLYIVDGGIHENDKERLLNSWAFDWLSVHWVLPDDSWYSDIPLWGRMTSDTYHRIMMPYFLPSSIQKAIWLDCDMVVKANLAELWAIDLEDNGALAVQDMVIPYVSSRYGIASYKELGIASDAKYFNAGVMVVNLDWWRRNRVTDKAFAYLKKYRKTVFFWDQEVLNAVLVGKWGEIDPRWNHIASVSGRSFFTVDHLDEVTYRQVIDDPWIVHFAGAWKPWIYQNDNPSRALYFQYLDMTAWTGWRPQKTFKTTIMGIYEAKLRDFLYPFEKWGMKLLRATTKKTLKPKVKS